MSVVPAYNSAGLPPLVLAVIVADMGTAEAPRMLHSTQEEPAGSLQAGIRDTMSLSP